MPEAVMRVALPIALLLSGCGFAADSALVRDGGAGGSCYTEADCGFGAVCTDFVCVPVSPTDVSFMVEVVPPPESPFARTHFLDPELGAGEIDLSLARPTTFDYDVLDAARAPISARVIITGDRRIPGREIDVFQTYAPDQAARFSLNPGLYAVRVVPAQDDLPGFGISSWEVRPAGEIVPKEFQLPAIYRRLSGDVSQRTANHVKLEGVSVHAVSIPSGLPSTKAVTDAAGRFSISLPETEDTTFRLVAERPPEAFPAWSFEQVVNVPLATDRQIAVRLEDTPDEIRGEARIRVLGMGEDGPEPVPGAHVALTASTSLDIKVFRTSGTTDRDGYVVVRSAAGEAPLRLIAASYVADITPPGGSPYARQTVTLDLSRVGRGTPEKHVELPRRIRVSGKVASPTGQPVAGARLELESVGGPRLLQIATTDGAGDYVVELDPGRYAARVDPLGASPTGEPLPVTFHEMVVPPSAPSVVLPPITLPSATAVRGVVTGAGAGPVPRADVELFVRYLGLTLSVGRTATDGAGRFSLVVPSQ